MPDMKVPTQLKHKWEGFKEGEFVNIIGVVEISDTARAICVNGSMFGEVPLTALKPLT